MIHINGRPGTALPGWFPNSLLPCYAFVSPGCIQLDLDQWPPSIQPASYIIILNVDSSVKYIFSIQTVSVFHTNNIFFEEFYQVTIKIIYHK